MLEIITITVLVLGTILAIGKYDYEKSLKNKQNI
jgi:hypothetical protein